MSQFVLELGAEAITPLARAIEHFTGRGDPSIQVMMMECDEAGFRDVGWSFAESLARLQRGEVATVLVRAQGDTAFSLLQAPSKAGQGRVHWRATIDGPASFDLARVSRIQAIPGIAYAMLAYEDSPDLSTVRLNDEATFPADYWTVVETAWANPGADITSAPIRKGPAFEKAESAR